MSKSIKKIVISIIAIILIIFALAIIKNIPENKSLKDEKQKTITISIFNKDNQSIFKEDIETNKTYLIDVLEENKNLKVVTEDSQYGKYITSIMGISQDENYYWSYYIDEQYATTGVSKCEIEENKHYSFKIEKFEY